MSKTSAFLKDNFSGRVGAGITAGALAVTMAFTPVAEGLIGSGGSAAYAQDRAVPTAHVPSSHTPASIDTSKPWARKAAFQASEGRIVLHYGEGIEEISAQLEAETLSDRGYPAIAVPGGPKGMVELFIGKKIIPGMYDKHKLNNGGLGSDAIELYNMIIKKIPVPEMVSLAR